MFAGVVLCCLYWADCAGQCWFCWTDSVGLVVLNKLLELGWLYWNGFSGSCWLYCVGCAGLVVFDWLCCAG